MTGREKITRCYLSKVRQPVGAADGYHVMYIPRTFRQGRVNGAPAESPPCFEAVVQFQGDEAAVRWPNAPVDPEVPLGDFEHDARDRVRALHDWLGRLETLVRPVEAWAREFGWATRRIDTALKDPQIGEYKAPGLLLQEGTDRVLLEPIGRTSPGVEGVVDLYLMPAYDDMASFYHYDGRWNLHYCFPGSGPVANVREAPAKPLSKESLQEVLAEMKQHAA